MSGNSNSNVLGVSVTTAGVAALPNTGGALRWFVILTIACGVIVLISTLGSRIYSRFARR